MKQPLPKLFTALILTVIVIVLLNSRFGMTPALGPFFSPFDGFWQNIEQDRSDQDFELSGLSDEVTVHYDDFGIPHIFATNQEDLMKAQGYIVAKERLWQMEFYALVASGRITEIIGEEALEFSQHMRNLGMVEGAEKALDNMMEDERSEQMVTAYAEGVNQYIDKLDAEELPIEYKVLGYEPEEWDPVNSGLILMNMAHILTGDPKDFMLTNTKEAFGEDFVNRFSPRYHESREYFIPDEGQFDFDPIKTDPPDNRVAANAPANLPFSEHNYGVGSNNWVVGESKTATDGPILSNDMHLGFSMPAIWIEMQLHSPELNSYGVTIPGAPSIVAGFNEALAWGFTNAYSDAMDIYEVEFRDESREEYRYEGEWREVEKQVETYEMPDGSEVHDTLRFTHHGPVINPIGQRPAEPYFPIGHSIKWTAHEPGNELLALYRMNQADNLDEFQRAKSHYEIPGQNFAYADTSGNIGIFHQGKYPVRWKGQGDFISDGSDAAYDWDQYIPQDHLPKSINPEKDFLGSANQKPVGEYYPYYLGRHYAPNYRGQRIHEMLEEASEIDINFLKDMIHDEYSNEASHILPHLLQWLQEEELEETQQTFSEDLGDWDFYYDGESRYAHFFDRWWQSIEDTIWSRAYPQTISPAKRPHREDLARELIENPEDEFWLNGNFESIEDLVTTIYRQEFSALVEEIGEPSEQWKLKNRQHVKMEHLGQIPGFGEKGLSPGGMDHALKATKEDFGDSWRMIVDLSEPVKAWGNFPGGTSGNPGSKYYTNFLNDWENSEMRELQFWKKADDAKPEFTYTLKP